jgi:outer membrane protein
MSMNKFKGAAMAASLTIGSFASLHGAIAADLPMLTKPTAAVFSDPNWFLRVGAAGLFFDASAKLKAAPIGLVPGASAKVGNNFTGLVELGYFVTNNISLQFTGGYPPLAKLTGQGAVAALGGLGKATYGPAAVIANYTFKNFGAFQPYVGVGAGYAIIFNSRDGAVRNLHVKGNGLALVQAGADYKLTRNWSVFVDVKHLFLSVNATGLALGTTVKARIKLDPTIVTTGLTYRW